MSDYLLRSIPPALWKRLKHLALERNTTVRQLILDQMQTAVDASSETGAPAEEQSQESPPIEDDPAYRGLGKSLLIVPAAVRRGEPWTPPRRKYPGELHVDPPRKKRNDPPLPPAPPHLPTLTAADYPPGLASGGFSPDENRKVHDIAQGLLKSLNPWDPSQV